MLTFTAHPKQLFAVGYVLYPSHRNYKHPLVYGLGTLPGINTCDEISYLFLSWDPYTYLPVHSRLDTKSVFMVQACISFFYYFVFILLLKCAEKLKKCEIEMRPNQAYETVSKPCPSKSATQIHTEPCPAYEDVVVQACN